MKSFFLGLALLSCLVSVKAQATITSEISCNAEISLRDGARISYQISGVVEFNDGDPGQIIGEPSLFVTVLRREKNGREKLVRSQLDYWGNAAPDADYSRLPFSEGFRAAPNDSRGIFYLPSAAYGLYIRLLPKDFSKFQVVHYLNRSKFVRSAALPCSFEGE